MVEITLNETHTNMIREMIPMYGMTEAEVIRTIIIMFLHEHLDQIDIVLSLTEFAAEGEGPIKFTRG